MSTIVKSLLVTLGFDVDDKGIERATRGLADIHAGFKMAASAVQKAAEVLHGFTSGVAATGQQLARQAQALGVSTDDVARLGYVAQQSGVKVEQFAAGMQTLANQAQAAGEGSAAAAGLFASLGVAVKDSSGQLRPMNDLLLDLADGFARMPDGTAKAAQAAKLFGGSAAAMIPMLNQGSATIRSLADEAQHYGLVMSADVIAASQEFGEQNQRLTASVEGLRRSIGGPLLADAGKLLWMLAEWIAANRELIASKVQEFVEAIGSALEYALWLLTPIVALTRWMIGGVLQVGGSAKTLSAVLKVIVTYLAAIALYQGIIFAFTALNKLIVAVRLLAAAYRLAGVRALWLAAASAFPGIAAAVNGAIAAVVGLAGAYRAAGITALIAQAKMIALPLLVGTAIAVIVGYFALMIEDIIVWFRGGESAIGGIWESFIGFIVALVGFVIRFIKNSLLGMWEWVLGWGKRLVGAFGLARSFVQSFILGLVQDGIKGLQILAKEIAAKLPGGQKVLEVITKFAGSAGLPDLGMSAAAAAAAPAGGVGGVAGAAAAGARSMSYETNNQFQIVTQPGQDPKAIADEVVRKMEEKNLRERQAAMAALVGA